MGDVLAVRDEYRLQSWAGIIGECQASGLTNKEFCAQRGIPEKTYYYLNTPGGMVNVDRRNGEYIPLKW